MRSTLFLTGGLLFLAGCGSGDEPRAGETAAGDVETVEAEAQSASAIDKSDIDCDKFKPQSAERGQAVDDIVGLRHGMTEEQVRGVLLCKNANYAINAGKNSASLPSGGQMSQVNLNADTGLDKVNVWLVGPSGAERVVHIDRTLEYPAGKEVPIASVAQEVARKYGSFDDAGYSNQGAGWIVRSRDGERMTNSNTSYAECRSHTLRTDKALPCVHAISYEISPTAQNPALASRFRVAITHFAMITQMANATKEHLAKTVERAEESVREEGLEL
ncbi:hypothetical protein BV98_002063 [Sphingobium herbicidovorans NBRC 16415]|uniref:Lipoprotein n=1 Tax=Sphingobium herbicidovorans (strain ATCC 700291 / DSM 11019 / CCUG 56400 / KCTC 2939 / LMG 18315 / NBRC 16415 / MH) TaxID=1219045 RepID=A0A086P9Q2_SPHHM|nr:hypothetical protein [Sphingobium herbicidovorans]KFG90120.1 hypothetical protein BV98_002063 [Sphingobium herbicidovorans NBRC 16415]